MRMKSIIVFLILFAPLLLPAQKKGDNTIIVSGVNADQMVTLLLNNAYRLEAMQDEFNEVRTNYKPVDPGGFEMALVIRIKDNRAYISGKWRKASFAGDIVYLKPKHSPQTEAFESMRHLALALHKPLAFDKL
jgi:hypothetical protein